MVAAVEKMAYVGEVPWHGLGNELTPDADLDTWIEQAGMDWHVKGSRLIYNTKHGAKQFENRMVLYRSDNEAPLGVVADDYKIVHPHDVMEFYRDLISDQGFEMQTAGVLFNGRKFWALARIGDSVKLKGIDEVVPYLLMATSCDGSMATVVHPTSVRVVCNNTLRMAIGPHAKEAKIKVPHSSQFEADAVKAQLGLLGDAWENFIGEMRVLADLKLNREEAIQIVADALKASWKNQEGEDMRPDEMLDSSKLLKRIVTLYDGEGLGAEFESAKGTGWGLVNAISQYTDNEAGLGADRSRAFERAHLTDRAGLKVKVADRLLAMAE